MAQHCCLPSLFSRHQLWAHGYGIITKVNKLSKQPICILFFSNRSKKGELVKIMDAAQLLTEGFPGSGYAARAALIAAHSAVQAGNNQSASDMLQWVLDHSDEPEVKDIARLRLANVLVDESKYDQALTLLNAQHAASFTGLYADLRGDALVASGKTEEARAAYQKALDSLGIQSAYRNVVQMKFDTLREQQ